ncbi:hypothetical protein [Sphingobacterium thalpophilum]|uniref:hypothetical protein n=1 Tax=Sphingobacterium thalpophilum TaxID=259 RepID=UPI003C74D56D
MENRIIDKVALIHIANKKVLSTRSKSKNKLYFPGGKRENNESDLEGLKREITEITYKDKNRTSAVDHLILDKLKSMNLID